MLDTTQVLKFDKLPEWTVNDEGDKHTCYYYGKRITIEGEDIDGYTWCVIMPNSPQGYGMQRGGRVMWSTLDIVKAAAVEDLKHELQDAYDRAVWLVNFWKKQGNTTNGISL